jgi:hypothetical protein
MCVNQATQSGLLRRMRQRDPSFEFDRKIFQRVDQVAIMPVISYFLCDCPEAFAETYDGDIGRCLVLLLEEAQRDVRRGVLVFSLFHNILQEFTESDLFLRADFVDKALDILEGSTDGLLVRKGFHFLRVALKDLWEDSQGKDYREIHNVISKHAERFNPQDTNGWRERTAFQLYCRGRPDILEMFIEPFFRVADVGFECGSAFAAAFVDAFARLKMPDQENLIERALGNKLSEAVSVKAPDRPISTSYPRFATSPSSTSSLQNWSSPEKRRSPRGKSQESVQSMLQSSTGCWDSPGS